MTPQPKDLENLLAQLSVSQPELTSWLHLRGLGAPYVAELARKLAWSLASSWQSHAHPPLYPALIRTMALELTTTVLLGIHQDYESHAPPTPRQTSF